MAYNNYGQQQQPPQQQYGQYGQQPGYGAPPPPAGMGYNQQQPPYPPQNQGYSNNQAGGYGSGYPAGPPAGPPPNHHPQQQQYGAPPPVPGGAYNSQPAYGAAPYPVQNQYQQPPSQGYHHQPPPPQQHQPPPQQKYGPPLYLGAVLATDPLAPYATVPQRLPNYDPAQDVDAIRKATKGFGTNENVLHRILCLRSADQMEVLVAGYKARHGKDLISVLKSETSGYHERTLVALAAGPVEGDADLLHEACSGPGTKELLLTELIIGRTPQELNMLRAAYQKKYHKNLDQVVSGELSMKTRDAFNIALQGRWTDNGYVDQNMLHRDVHELQNTFRLGFTDELLVCSVIFCRSPIYLQALCGAFKQSNGKSLTKEIKQHFFGHMQDALLYAVEGGKKDGTGAWRDAKMLEKAMAGAGTKDQQLIWRIVRAHWNRPRFEQIKQAYQLKYRRSLVSRVKGETTGHFENVLVAIIDGK